MQLINFDHYLPGAFQVETAPKSISLQSRIHAMLRVADSDELDEVLLAVSRMLVLRRSRGCPGHVDQRALQEHLDELELLFSLELAALDC